MLIYFILLNRQDKLAAYYC